MSRLVLLLAAGLALKNLMLPSEMFGGTEIWTLCASSVALAATFAAAVLAVPVRYRVSAAIAGSLLASLIFLADVVHFRRFTDVITFAQSGGAHQLMIPFVWRANLLVIQAESLLAFPLDLSIAGRPVTPNLQRFARDSVVFDRVFDQTHGGGTSDAVVAAMASAHPLPEGSIPHQAPGARFRAMPHVLGGAGYSTLAACGCASYVWDFGTLFDRLGFRSLLFEPDFDGSQRHIWIKDRSFFDQVAPRLASLPPPFFAFLVSASNHVPYHIAAADSGFALPHWLEGTKLGHYMQSIHYFDSAFGALLAALEHADLLETTAIAVYGDHTGLWEWPDELARLLDMRALTDLDRRLALARVPFMMRLPGRQLAGSKETGTGGQLDIPQTLLSALGITDERSLMLGRDLTGPDEALVAFRDGSFLDDSVMYVHRQGSRQAECFEVTTSARVSCGPYDEKHLRGLARLRLSNAIVQQGLAPDLAGRSPTTR